MEETKPLENIILYDWLTFSSAIHDRDSIIEYLGLSNVQWVTELGSKLKYDERWYFMGISIHFSYPGTHKNPGVCVEMSGQGCRAFETFGNKSFDDVFKYCLDLGLHITRLDVALDDFTGLIDIQEMARAARSFEFRCRCKSVGVIFECPDQDSEHKALTVNHGSRSSKTFIRCYDKRAERGAFEEYLHWVRLEIQLRAENAMTFAALPHPIGEKYFGVLSNYLAYLVPSETDSNKSRWAVAPWWENLLQGAQKISVYTAKDIDYNKSRLERYVYNMAGNAVSAIIQCDGVEKFVEWMKELVPTLPEKYQKIIREVEFMKAWNQFDLLVDAKEY